MCMTCASTAASTAGNAPVFAALGLSAAAAIGAGVTRALGRFTPVGKTAPPAGDDSPPADDGGGAAEGPPGA